MTPLSYIIILVCAAVMIGYVNHRFIGLHTTIATMVSALVISLIMLFLSRVGLSSWHIALRHFVESLHFHQLVMNFMLGLLLFAGALTINLNLLKAQKWEIALLALVGTILSAFIIGGILYGLLHLIGLPLDFAYCMIFGSLISPTDPIAVLAIFKQLHAPQKLETAVAAESLFNDGVGVVLFITAYHVAFTGENVSTVSVLGLFLREAVGGIIFGIVFGWILCQLLRPLRDIKLEVILSVGLVIGAYSLAQKLEISGPLAMVAAGIMVANYKRHLTLLPLSRHYLETIWEMIDEVLNMVLFLMLGFEILIVHYDWRKLVITLIMIAATLLTRYVIVAIPMTALRPWREKIPYTISILTWGGLRGGLAVALVLALPQGEVRSWLLALTYGIVLFSILVQGTTIKWLISSSKRRVD